MLKYHCIYAWSFPGGPVVKNWPANAGDCGFDPWIGKIPWGRKWQPTPVFLPGKSHGQRSLPGYSPRGHKRVRCNWATIQHQQQCLCLPFPLESVFWVLLIWCAAIHGVAKSRTQLRDWTELNWIRVQSRPACVVIIQCSPRLRSAVFSCSPHPMTDSEVLLVVLLPRLEQLAENGGFAAPFFCTPGKLHFPIVGLVCLLISCYMNTERSKWENEY